MQIKIKDESFYLVVSLLLIAFFPQIHLCLTFAMMMIVELFERLKKAMHASIKILTEYIFPAAVIFLLYLSIVNILILTLKTILRLTINLKCSNIFLY
jgi:hypothetical protein